MAATQEYESIAMDAEDADDEDDDDDDNDDIDNDNDDIERSPMKRSPPKKRPPKKRRAPPDGGGCCRYFCSFFCAFLLALLVVLGLLGGAYYVLTQQGYRFSATQSDDNASDSLWIGHGWHQPKSFDSHDAATVESSDNDNISINNMSRGHNTEGQQPPAEIPQQEEVPAVRKPSHISVTNTVPGVSVVAVQKPGGTATTGVDVNQVDPIAVDVASPTTQPESTPTNEEQPTVDHSTEDEHDPAQPSVEGKPGPAQPPAEDESPDTTSTKGDAGDQVNDHTLDHSSEPEDKASDDDALSKFRSSPP